MTGAVRRIAAVLAVLGCVAATASCRARARSGTPPPPPTITSTGWHVAVYYTAVESRYHGHPVRVAGCRDLDCVHGDAPLGRYPADFVHSVHEQGAGRITSGPHTGHFLNWSAETGYWLDSEPRDAHGRPLEPFHTAAAGLPDGTQIRLLSCGHRRDGKPIAPDLCHRLSTAHWQVLDTYPGHDNRRDIGLYIGPETTTGFTGSQRDTTLVDATITVS